MRYTYGLEEKKLPFSDWSIINYSFVLSNYLVQCILFRPMTGDSLRCIDVWAENIEDAKIRAVAILRARGYPDAFVAPEIEEIPIVIELDPKSTMMVGMP